MSMSEPVFDPYLVPGTDLLRNLPGARTQRELAEIEHSLVTARALELMEDPPVPDGTVAQLRSIHRFLFQDVYDWAGELRTINITKGGSFFLPVEVFDTGIRYCEDTLRGDGLLRGMDHDTFVKRLSVNYDNFNVLHPFREGNGRTQRMFWDLIAQAAGWHFDWNLTDRGENDRASIMALRDSDLSLLETMFNRIVKPLDEDLSVDRPVSMFMHGDAEMSAGIVTPQEYRRLAQRYAPGVIGRPGEQRDAHHAHRRRRPR